MIIMFLFFRFSLRFIPVYRPFYKDEPGNNGEPKIKKAKKVKLIYKLDVYIYISYHNLFFLYLYIYIYGLIYIIYICMCVCVNSHMQTYISNDACKLVCFLLFKFKKHNTLYV